MTIDKTIQMARGYLKAGNGGAYARILSGAIRSAASSYKAERAYRAAIIEDQAQHLFAGLNTSTPIAAKEA